MYLRTYSLCSIFASLSGFHFGFDTGSIGPVTVMPQFKAQFDPISPILQGLIVSSILMTASLSSVLAGPLSDRFSRTRTFGTGAGIFCVGSVISSCAYNLAMLFVGRLITGVGEGLFLSTVTVYILEIAPTSIRGQLSCTTQLFVTLGVASGYFFSYGTVNIDSSLSWRLLFITQATVSLVFCIGSFFLPHSPRWLRHVGRIEESKRAWERLGYTATEAEKEQEVVQREHNEGAAPARADAERRSGWLDTARMLFKKDIRRRTVLGIFLMGMQQACGIDGVLYYAPVLFSQAGLSSTTSAFLASGVSGLLNVACTIVTQIFTDDWGRRPSMIWGGSVISGTMLLIGILYASDASATAAGRWTVIALIYIFIVAFAMSWAVVNRIYCSEIQPMRTRAAATSLGQCANWAVNWIIAFTTPLFLHASSSGPYFLFGTCALITVVVCFLFQPESKGVSLEGLDSIFEISPWRRWMRRRASRMHNTREEPIALRPISST
ncbi:general substrate transporter [Dentipellis sp. KUC8613]|nr:general substrate transporter [Dentipellis sp. KUC8613]